MLEAEARALGVEVLQHQPLTDRIRTQCKVGASDAANRGSEFPPRFITARLPDDVFTILIDPAKTNL